MIQDNKDMMKKTDEEGKKKLKALQIGYTMQIEGLERKTRKV